MTMFSFPNDNVDIQQQRVEWRKKSWSIPDFRGKKVDWYSTIIVLIEQVHNGSACDLDTTPQIQNTPNVSTWRSYAPFLKGIGLVNNQSGTLHLSDVGIDFADNPTHRKIADLLQDRFRLFGEVLYIVSLEPITIEDVDKVINEQYGLNWNNLSHTRKRMDWLEVLELIQCVGNRKWTVTESGKQALNEWHIYSPDAIKAADTESIEIEIPEPPNEIAALLQPLFDNPKLHSERSTYNIWAPSPNRIENLRNIIQYASERVERAEFFKYISDEFNLKASSVDSMMPFLKASGLLEEVGRNVYSATSAAKAWLATGNDLDFIRIIHSHMRFIGEMIITSENDIVRNDMYAQARNYGLNTEKARWIAGFLLEAGLLEEPQYLHLKATRIGIEFANNLPLAEKPDLSQSQDINTSDHTIPEIQADSEDDLIFDLLSSSARDPMAEGKASGVAFEEAIAKVFRFMGFDAKRIGGSGDTDVIVRWRDNDGKCITAIVDGKSKTGGSVSHTDISDVAIDTHKEKNSADFVAIVGPGFSGDTIRNHARKKKFALITDSALIDIARTTKALGMSLQEISMLFHVPDGLSQLDELISARQRELDIITVVISKFCKEQDILGSLSPRDLFLLLRAENVSPSLEELIAVFEMLSKAEIGVLDSVNSSKSPENSTYTLNRSKGTVNKLRALASAVEKGLC